MPQAPLAEAYAECRRLHAKHGKTYYFSTQMFPPALRQSVHALYGFVRYPDELVDNPRPGTNPADELNRYRDETRRALLTGDSDIPVLKAFADTAAKAKMPAHLPMAFLDAMCMDLTVTRYPTFQDLTNYTYGSASVVGLMMCALFGVTDADTLQRAHDLGLAMQLTNFWRDIGEDWRERGRIYLPLEDMDRFAYTEAMLNAGTLNEQFRHLMQFQIGRARKYYASADLGIPALPADAQLPVRLARVLYSRILTKIEDNGCDVFTCRARTSKAEKLAVLAREAVVAAFAARTGTDTPRAVFRG